MRRTKSAAVARLARLLADNPTNEAYRRALAWALAEVASQPVAAADEVAA